MSSGERPIGTAKGKPPNTEALCQPPPPPRRGSPPSFCRREGGKGRHLAPIRCGGWADRRAQRGADKGPVVVVGGGGGGCVRLPLGF